MSVAGTRWAVETCLENAKGAVGLDQHQVGRWDSRHRYTALIMLAAAILTARARDGSKCGGICGYGCARHDTERHSILVDGIRVGSVVGARARSMLGPFEH